MRLWYKATSNSLLCFDIYCLGAGSAEFDDEIVSSNKIIHLNCVLGIKLCREVCQSFRQAASCGSVWYEQQYFVMSEP